MLLETLNNAGDCCTLRPLCFVQLSHTRGSTLVCSCCGGFAAGARGQLVAKDLPTSGEALEEALRRVPGDASSHQATYCSLGCGEIFCSPECEAQAQGSGHQLLCVGPCASQRPVEPRLPTPTQPTVSFDDNARALSLSLSLFSLSLTHTHLVVALHRLTEEAPMYHLKVVALHCGHYETLVLATKLAAQAASGDEAARRFLCDVVPKHAPWSAAEGDDAAAEELLDYIGEVYDGPDGLPRIRSMRLGLGGSPPRSDPAVAQSRA